MSNLLKSKFLLGALVVTAMFVGVAVSTASADCSVTPTLKVGSTGASVQCLQTKLGLSADGSFGPMTDAAVKSFQSSHGLTADGVVGPMSAAALNGMVASGGSYPAGCTSSSGFSSTTGQSCSASSTLPAGCTSSSGFSSTTGQSCSASSTLPAGCSSTSGYSTTTGASCSGSSSSSSGPLGGGAADISLSSTGTDVESSVSEGETKNVLGFKVEASGGDVAVTNVKVTLENTDTDSSYRLSRYASKVDVYMGSTKVGSADVADFTQHNASDSECGANKCYTKTIALSNAVVREGSSKKATFYVRVSALSNIDSLDVETNDWDVTVDNIRFQDSTGVILTSGDSESSTFNFTDLSTSGDAKLTISKGSSSPVAQNVEVSDTATTSDVLLLEFKLKATGSDMTFDQLTFAFDGTVAGANTLDDVINDLTLKKGSTVLASSPTLTANDDQNVTFDLDDTYTLSKDSTDTFRVYAKINKVNAHFTSEDGVKVSLLNTGIAAEDENGDVVTTESGSAVGEKQTLISNGAVVSYVSDSYTAEIFGSAAADGTIGLKFKVEAFGDNDVVFADDGSDFTYALTGATETDAVVTSSDLTASVGDFTVSSGSSATFTLSLKFNTTTGFVQLSLTDLAGTPVANVKTAAH